MIHDAHAFRGEYIDLCAQVERWATTLLRSEAAARSGRVDHKLPYLFGHKLKLVSELATSDAQVFSKPVSVAKLMVAFEPFARTRSELAHATVRVATCDADELYIFELPDATIPAINPTRFWMTPGEATDILRDLKKIRKLICDQKSKAVVKAQPNPQHSACPASHSPPASDISAPSRS